MYLFTFIRLREATTAGNFRTRNLSELQLKQNLVKPVGSHKVRLEWGGGEVKIQIQAAGPIGLFKERTVGGV